jgi:molybdopterin-containing oxidoreductase family membrane subunit
MLGHRQVSEDIVTALRPPGASYKFAMAVLALGIATMVAAWIYQIRLGMGVAGISHPVGWGVYIGSFVFWVGIAHSGTLISAILYLARSRWRTAISRSAEAMTIVAIMTAGLFPLVHLGRFWVAYYILPYPSQRQIWPNFQSPLVFDVLAISTYFTVSLVFFYVGMVPDIAAARDALRQTGRQRLQQRLYHWLALGWHGTSEQWRHYGRAYLFFAALATPLVISVHSVVSWDFAAGLLPGWHSTLLAPYFVAGAIHSGLAMVLTLLIPLRKLLGFENLILPRHFEDVARVMIVTTLIIGYSYGIELFMAWYSGDVFERQFALWRLTGSWWPFYPIIVICNVLLPLLFVFKRVRTDMTLLFVISLFVNIGMWAERLWIVTTSMARDFLPHNWGGYFPTWVELTILTGSFALFFFGFLVLAKFFPAAPMSDIKTETEEEHQEGKKVRREEGKKGGDDDKLAFSPSHLPTLLPSSRIRRPSARMRTGVVGVFGTADGLLEAVDRLRDRASHGLETYTPLRLDELSSQMGRGKSPVRYWTLVGALSGLAGGFALSIGAALVNSLIVGGKHPVSIIPYCVPAFEGTILLGALGNLLGMLVHTRLPRWRTPPGYDWQFSQDKFGLFLAARPEELEAVRQVMESTSPERIDVVP